MNDHFGTAFTRAGMLVVAACCVAAPAWADRSIRLDRGSVIPVRLNDALSSDRSRKGDTFSTSVRAGDGEDYGLPPGTRIDGVVSGARPQRGRDPGVIELSFDRVRLPDGRSYAVDGSLIGLDNKSVDRRSDGRLVAKPSHQNDRLTYAGYGAAAGLIVGLLSNHPLEDTTLGGLIGFGLGSLQKSKSSARDVVLKPGTEMGVRIDNQATVPVGLRSGDIRPSYRVRAGAPDFGTGGRPDAVDPTEIGAMLDDKDITFASTARPIITRGDVVLVPIVPILRAERVPYRYDGTTQTLRTTATAPVRLVVGSPIAVVDGDHRVRLEAPVQRINGTLYAPMKALSLATGCAVRFDEGSKTVVLTTR
ncbi:MAG TPA: stalk domain-containing protein [Chthonomonadaceae bacterium]|nr:stalk domain-containing protein [Chthonomonadaceae bacterium]